MLKYCSSPWDSVYIQTTGDVGMCVCPAWQTKGAIGNLLKTSLGVVFESEKAADFRRSFFDQNFKYCNSNICTNYWRMDDVESLDFTKDLPKLPKTLMLQLEKNCNLKCESCRSTNIYSKDINPTILKILNTLSTDYADFTEKVNVFADGLGEVFVSPSYLEWLNSDKVPKCFKFNFYSNGNLLTKNKDIIEKFKDQIEIVQVSFDAATNDTYKIVRGGDFDLVKNGVKMLRDLGIPVWTQFVTQYKNYHEMLDYVKLCQELDVERIGLQIIFRWSHMSNEWWNANRLDGNPNVNYDLLFKMIDEIKQIPQCELSGGLINIEANKIVHQLYNKSH